MLGRRIALLMIAAIVSVGTVLGARVWLQNQLASREAPAAAPQVAQSTRMVLVAKTDMPAGQFVRPENLRWQPWPEDGVAESYVVEGKGKLEDFVGAVVRSGISVGEPVIDGRVVRPGDRGFLSAVLTPGNRAITVPVTPSSGLAGFAFPGDHVDVILTVTIQPETKDGQKEGPERRASETVLTDIRVLAVDQRADDQKHEVAVAKTATLEVTPKQAEVMSVVSEMGKISLTLRSLAQETQVAGETAPYTWDVDAASLLRAIPRLNNAATQAQAKGEEKQSRRVTVVRGTEKTEVDFASMATE